MAKLEDPGYFDGSFKVVSKYVKIFAFTKTLPANEALTVQLRLNFENIATDEILKPVSEVLVTIDVNVVCIPLSDVEQGVKQGVKRGLERGV